MLKNDEINHKGALGLILYSMISPANRDITVWTKEIEQHYLKSYGIEKIKIIAESIQHYFEHKDLDLGEILPSLNATIEEKEKFLKFILKGFEQSGLV